MKTTDQISAAIETAQFLIKLALEANSPQILVMTDVISSNCTIAGQAMIDGSDSSKWHYPVANLINDLLVISEDITRSKLDQKIAIALLFRLTSEKMRACLQESRHSINRKQESKKLASAAGLTDTFRNLN